MRIGVTIEGGETNVIAWNDFARHNADAFSESELQDIEDVLAAGGQYLTGGGAAPLITLVALGV